MDLHVNRSHEKEWGLTARSCPGRQGWEAEERGPASTDSREGHRAVRKGSLGRGFPEKGRPTARRALSTKGRENAHRPVWAGETRG